MKLWINLIVVGILSGTLLGVFLKGIEEITGKAVYVLLLNVDYVPVLKNWRLNEILEFLLHLMVSSILVILFYFIFKKRKIHSKISPYIIVNIIIGSILYLTTGFSERTPEIPDMIAFFYWIIGHSIYGVVVGMLIIFLRLKEG